MKPVLDETHDPKACSWVESANSTNMDFPIQNLALGVFGRRGQREKHIGVAIGDGVLDLHACVESGLLGSLDDATAGACRTETLNALMALSSAQRVRLRRALFHVPSAKAEGATRIAALKLVLPMTKTEMFLPVSVGDYTDFYASIFHATNVGSIFRPNNPLLPNYKWVPIGYHGRASSLVASGESIRRPSGQVIREGAITPVYRPTRRLDYELEVGMYVADRGEAVNVRDVVRRYCVEWICCGAKPAIRFSLQIVHRPEIKEAITAPNDIPCESYRDPTQAREILLL